MTQSTNSSAGLPRKRLGKGLSGLLSDPVRIDPPIQVTSEAPPAGASVEMIPVAVIFPSPYQPRKVMDEESLQHLANSIKRDGVLQPILVRPRSASGGGGAGYELIAGERRWRASMAAGLERIPALVRIMSDDDAAAHALIENLQREDLNAIERAEAFDALGRRLQLTPAQVAERVGLDRSTVANFLRLLELEEPIRALVSEGRLAMGHGRALLAAPPGPGRISLAKAAAEEAWSVRALERRAAAAAATSKRISHVELAALVENDESGGEGAPARAPDIAELERQIALHLGTKVSIQVGSRAKRGKLTIEFYGIDHFEGLLAKMGMRTM